MKKSFLSTSVVLVIFSALSSVHAQDSAKLKACFIYDNAVSEYGWTASHDAGRKAAEKALPWLETKFVEKVKPGTTGPVIDQLVSEKCQVIFTTSGGFMDDTYAAAQKYPNIIFMHANGYKFAPNMGRYMAELYQTYYLNGMIAAGLSKSGKIGYIATMKVPQLNRHINAFALGARAVNPKIQINVKWLGGWFNPELAKAAAEKLVAEGNDALISSEESPAVLQVAEAHKIVGFSHSTPMTKWAPNSAVSGQLLHWENIYMNVLKNVKSGVYTNKNMAKVDHFSLLRGGAVELGAQPGMAINPKWVPQLKAAKMNVNGQSVSVYDRVMQLEKIMETSDKFEPFTGPIVGESGRIEIQAKERPSEFALLNMNWMVKDIRQEDMQK